LTQPDQQQRQPNFQAVAGNLQQRIAEQAARYEGELALVREQYDFEIEQLKQQLQNGQSNVVASQAVSTAPASNSAL